MSNAKKYWDRLLEGWPVYSAIAIFLFSYSEFWIEKKIADGVALQVGSHIRTEVSLLSDDVDDLEQSIGRLDASVSELNSDVKAVLLHLAGD